MAELTPEQRAKISEGMKRAHARKKKWLKKSGGNKKAPAAKPGGSLLGQLKAEYAELGRAIAFLEKRGVR